MSRGDLGQPPWTLNIDRVTKALRVRSSYLDGNRAGEPTNIILWQTSHDMFLFFLFLPSLQYFLVLANQKRAACFHHIQYGDVLVCSTQKPICLHRNLAAEIAVSLPPDSFSLQVPAGSPSRGGNVTVYVYDMNQPSLPAPLVQFLCVFSVFMALSTVFHSIDSPDNSPLSHSVLPVLSLPYGSFQLYVSL